MFVDFLFDELRRPLRRILARAEGLVHPRIARLREAAHLEIRIKKAPFTVLIRRGRRQSVDRRRKTCEIYYQQKYELSSPTSHFFPFSKYDNTVQHSLPDLGPQPILPVSTQNLIYKQTQAKPKTSKKTDVRPDLHAVFMVDLLNLLW